MTISQQTTPAHLPLLSLWGRSPTFAILSMKFRTKKFIKKSNGFNRLGGLRPRLGVGS